MPDELYDLTLRVRSEGIKAVKDLKSDVDALDPALLQDAKRIKELDQQLRQYSKTVQDLSRTLASLKVSGLTSGALGAGRPGQAISDLVSPALREAQQRLQSFGQTTSGGSRVSKISSQPSILEIDRAIANIKAVREINERAKALEVIQRTAQLSSAPGPPQRTLPSQLVARQQLVQPTPVVNQQEVLRVIAKEFAEAANQLRVRLREQDRRVGFEEVDARTRRTIAPGGRKVSSIGPEVTREPLGEAAIRLGDQQANLGRVLRFINKALKSTEASANAVRIIEESLASAGSKLSGDQRLLGAASKISSRLRAVDSGRAKPFSEQAIQTDVLPRAFNALQLSEESPVAIRPGETFAGVRNSVRELNRNLAKSVDELQKSSVDPELRQKLEKVLRQRQIAFKQLMREHETRAAEERARIEIEERRKALQASRIPRTGALGAAQAASKPVDVQKRVNELFGPVGLRPFLKGEAGSVNVTQLKSLATEVAGGVQRGVRSIGKGFGLFQPSVDERLASGDIFRETKDPQEIQRQERLQQQISRAQGVIGGSRERFEENEQSRQAKLVEAVSAAQDKIVSIRQASAEKIKAIESSLQKNFNENQKVRQKLAEDFAKAEERFALRVQGAKLKEARASEQQHRAEEAARKSLLQIEQALPVGLSREQREKAARAEEQRIQTRLAQANRALAQAQAVSKFELSKTVEEEQQARVEAPIPIVKERRSAARELDRIREELVQKERDDSRKRQEIESNLESRKVLEAQKSEARISAVNQKRVAQETAISEKGARERATLRQRELAQEARIAQVKKEFILQENALRSRGEGRFGGEFAFAATALLGYFATLKQVGVETVKYAARTETLRVVTQQMAETNRLNVGTVEAYAEAVHKQNITTQEANLLIQKMIFAQLDVAKSTALAKVAQDAAVIANVNSSEALERVIRGITTGQSRILFNLGIQVSLQETVLELRRKLRAEGIDREPSVVERRQAQLNRVLLEGAKIAGSYERAMLTAGKQLTSLQREVEEAQNAIGQEFLPEFGRLIGLTRDSLVFAQENGKAFALLASVITGLGAALSVLASSRFFSFLVGGAGAHPAVRIAAVVAAIGSIVALNQDDVAALNRTAEDAIEANEKKLVDAQERFARAKRNLAAASSAEDRKNAEDNLKIAEEEVKSRGRARVAIEDDLVRLKAELYLRDVENFKKAQEARLRITSEIAHRIANPTLSDFFNPLGAVGGTNVIGEQLFGGTDLGFSGFFGRIGQTLGFGSGPQPADAETKTRADLIQKAKETALLTGEVVDREQAYRRTILQEAQRIGTAIGEISDKLGEGAQSISQLSFFGGAAEKIAFERKETVRNIEQFFKDVGAARKRADQGQGEDLARIALAVGHTENVKEGLQKLKELEDRFTNLGSALDKRSSLEFSKLGRETAAAKVSLEERIALARQAATVIEGSHEDEIRQIAANRDIRLRFNRELVKVTNDRVSAVRRAAEIESDSIVQNIELQNKQAQAIRKTAEAFDQQLRSAAAQERARRPGGRTREEVAGDLLSDELDRISRVSNAQDRADQLRTLALENQSRLRDVAFQKEAESEEFLIAQIQKRQEVSERRDRALSDLAPASRREIRALEEIDRTAGEALRALEKQNEVKRESVAVDVLAHETRIKQIQIEKDRELARIDAAKDGIESLNRARLEQHETEFRRLSRIAELSVTTPAEEAAVALKLHQLKIGLIQKEFEIRGKGEDAAIDRIKKTGEANFEFLGNLLEIRKREIEQVRNSAESVFDALTSKGGEGIRDLLSAQARVIGRQIFGNLSVEVFKNARESLGSVIPGQRDPETKAPTFVGRLLGGTLFSPSQTSDIQDQILDVNSDALIVEREIQRGIERLTDVVREGSIVGQQADIPLKDPDSILYFTERAINSATRIRGQDELALKDPSRLIEIFGTVVPEKISAGLQASEEKRISLGKRSSDILLASIRPEASMFGGVPASIGQKAEAVREDLSSTLSTVSAAVKGGTSQAKTVAAGLSDSAAKVRGVATSLGFSVPGGDLFSAASKTASTALSITSPGQLSASGASGLGTAGQLLQGFPFNPQVPTSAGGRFALGFSSGVFGRPGNLAKAITGGDFSVQLGPGQATTASSQGLTTTGARVGQVAGAGVTAAAGTLSAISGFKEGGARGNLQGISGVLTAASIVPGPQQPFIQAAALITGFIGSLFGSSKETFEKELSDFLDSTKFEAPDVVTKTQDIGSGDVDFSIRDQPRTIVNRIELTVNALDSKSVIDRSADIAAAIHKEFSLDNATLRNDVQASLFNS